MWLRSGLHRSSGSFFRAHCGEVCGKFRIPGTTDQSGPGTEDLLTEAGFLSAVRCALSLVEGGLLWLAPVCSSFVYLNSVRTKRTKTNPRGDEAYKPAQASNLHAQVAAFLFALASLRNVMVVLKPSWQLYLPVPDAT